MYKLQTVLKELTKRFNEQQDHTEVLNLVTKDCIVIVYSAELMRYTIDINQTGFRTRSLCRIAELVTDISNGVIVAPR